MVAVLGATSTGCLDLFREATERPPAVDGAVDGALDGDPGRGPIDRGGPERDGRAPDMPSACVAADETCDGTDQDCDGRIDEGIAAPDCGAGVCVGLRPTCEGAAGWVCPPPDAIPRYEADESRCDGVDNDCDGRVDEAQAIGAACSIGRGGCRATGTWVCDGIGAARCTAAPTEPVAERCNGIDDDCDGTVDEPPPGEDPFDPRITGTCQVSRRGCLLTGVTVCADDGAGAVCRIDDAADPIEVCDGLDNDCDGAVDEGCDTVQVAVGGRHACSRQRDGSIHCWGNDYFGNVRQQPRGLFTALSAGEYTTCGLRVGGAADAGADPGGKICWGRAPSESLRRAHVAVSLGRDDSMCAIDGEPGGVGALTCAAVDGLDAAPRGPFGAVGVGDGYACAIREDGAVRCWGGNANGVEGDGRMGPYRAISTSDDNGCALADDGHVECWGLAAPPPPDGAFAALPEGAARYTHCATRQDTGLLACWGDPSAPATLNPPMVPFASVSGGVNQYCGVRRDGVIDCWGLNASGVLDTPDEDIARLSTGSLAAQICGTRASGGDGLVCWGQTFDGQTPFDGPVAAFAVGRRHTCALDDDGAPRCAGVSGLADHPLPPGPFSELACGVSACCAVRDGDPPPGGSAIDCWFVEDDAWASLTLPGAYHTLRIGEHSACALDPEGRMFCFDPTDGRDAPEHVAAPRAVTHDYDISGHSGCAIDDAGEGVGPLTCWGVDDEITTHPPGVFSQISCGRNGCCAVRDTGALRCWGEIDYTHITPPEGRFVAVEVGSYFACALDATQGVHCWGGLH